MNIEIREITDDDLASIQSLVQTSFGRTNLDDLKDQSLGILSFIVAWLDGVPTAYGFVNWPGAWSLEVRHEVPGTPEIYRLTVLDGAQSKGLGTKIVNYIEALVEVKGFSFIGLGVSHSNQRANELYKRLGYAEVVSAYYNEYKFVDQHGDINVVREKCRYMRKSVVALKQVRESKC